MSTDTAGRRSKRARKSTDYALDPLSEVLSDAERGTKRTGARDQAGDEDSEDDRAFEDASAEEDEDEDDEDDDDSSAEEESDDEADGSPAPRSTTSQKPLRIHFDLDIPSLPGTRYPIDLEPMQLTTLEMARDRWLATPILPLRSSGFAPSPYIASRTRENDDLQWLDRIISSQITQPLAESAAAAYLPSDNLTASFLMGPRDSQQKFSLKTRQSMNLNQAWQAGKPAQRISRHGWMVNVGGRVTSMDWLSNRGKENQIIALTVLSKENMEASRRCSAAAPLPSNPASIQIWLVAASQASGKTGQLTSAQPPKLLSILCADWGEVKQLKWCPFSHSPLSNSLGLLAAVWGDGNVRVINVEGEANFLNPLSCIKITQPFFSQSCPGTVCTSVTWLSTKTIAVGHADGSISVWDIPSSTLLQNHKLHSSYILDIVNAYPSHPFTIATLSSSGDLNLTDLSSQTLKTTLIIQQNISHSGTLSWMEHLQAFVVFDSVRAIKLYPIVNLNASSLVCSTESMAMSTGTSPNHPFLLFAGDGGEVVAVNPLRRLLDRKQAQYPPYQQTWFKHDWQSTATEQDPHASLSRILEGFKAQPIAFPEPQAVDMRTAKGKLTVGRSQVVGWQWPEQLVHPLETSVTQVAWNPNIECGAWAAAVTGCGLLRIEDLLLG